MLWKAKGFYDGTLRRIGPLHRLVRALAWKGGDLAVGLLSAVLRFDLPRDDLLPLYKLELLLGTYESRTVRRYRSLIPPGAVVFDVGAHVGYHTLRFARLVGPAGRVFAFEPHPANVRLLRRNVERRGLDQVTLIPQAVSDAPGRQPFHETALSMGHSLWPLKEHTGRVEVAQTSLDRFAAEHEVDHADLIKIDVEGSEPEVLEGMRDLAARSRNLSVIVEFKPSLLARRGYPPARLLERLASMGLTVSAIGARGGLTPPPRDPTALEALGTCNLLATRAAGGGRP
jgi:FkbM family methyltransferase